MKLSVEIAQYNEDNNIDDLSWADDELKADIKFIVINALNANGYLVDVEVVPT